MKRNIRILAAFAVGIILLSAVTLGLTSCNLFSHIKKHGDFGYVEVEGGYKLVERYRYYRNELVIPAEAGGKKVVAIGEGALGGGDFTSVVIPETVTVIEDRAFSGCFRLVEVYNKSSLNITAGSESHGSVAEYARNVYTQEGGSKLTYDGSARIFDGYLLCDYSGGGEYSVPDGITEIGTSAFLYNESVTAVKLSDSVKSVGGSAFDNCVNLTSVTLGGVESLGNDVFKDCKRLTTLNFGGALRTLGDRAFLACTSLSGISFPEGVEKIGKYAFMGCSALKSAALPATLTECGELAFDSCRALESITVAEGNGAYASLDGVLFTKDFTKLIRYPIGKSGSSYAIPDSVVEIESEAFLGAKQLNGFTVGDQVRYIGYCAFQETGYYYDSNNWEGGNVLYVGNYLVSSEFGDDTSVTSYKVREGTVCIAEFAINSLYGIKSLELPASLVGIGKDNFKFATELTSVKFGDRNGWKIDGTEVGADVLGDPATAAKTLIDSHEKAWAK